MQRRRPPPIARCRTCSSVRLSKPEGTEAAAVTAIRMGVTSAPPPPFTIVADRPFFYAIVDDETDTFLFTGWMADPK